MVLISSAFMVLFIFLSVSQYYNDLWLSRCVNVHKKELLKELFFLRSAPYACAVPSLYSDHMFSVPWMSQGKGLKGFILKLGALTTWPLTGCISSPSSFLPCQCCVRTKSGAALTAVSENECTLHTHFIQYLY